MVSLTIFRSRGKRRRRSSIDRQQQRAKRGSIDISSIAVLLSSLDKVLVSLFLLSLPALCISSRYIAYLPLAPGIASSRSLPYSTLALGGTLVSLFNIAVPPVSLVDAQQLIFAIQDTELSSLQLSYPGSKYSSSRSTKYIS